MINAVLGVAWYARIIDCNAMSQKFIYMYRKIIKKFICFFSLVFSMSLFAGDVAFGTLKGIKLYDFSNNKSIRIYFNADATKVNENCIHGGTAVAIISKVNHDEPTVNRMLSMLLSAQMSGKKVRIHSEGAGCEVDFVAVQETYF
ncbi:hypothetical protein [Grimontia sp. NTOU-MAR1]|uniref:hypothetical protein n=1 Tax=Grimontia sp. NTOU-MAR1 TaxID=3111011 RepID=UPI002DBE0552|nr:hypothetical protein [Grimontia sp. NTOU-MAR1]WRV97958.1 hypothetical protein VP504_00520 [Grimontia sp. NTOU-MAR1]